jgi:hypothetical protein
MKTAVHIILNSPCTDKDIRRNTGSNTNSSTTIPIGCPQKKPANLNRNSFGSTVVNLGLGGTIPECVIPLSVNADTQINMYLKGFCHPLSPRSSFAATHRPGSETMYRIC